MNKQQFIDAAEALAELAHTSNLGIEFLFARVDGDQVFVTGSYTNHGQQRMACTIIAEEAASSKHCNHFLCALERVRRVYEENQPNKVDPTHN